MSLTVDFATSCWALWQYLRCNQGPRIRAYIHSWRSGTHQFPRDQTMWFGGRQTWSTWNYCKTRNNADVSKGSTGSLHRGGMIYVLFCFNCSDLVNSRLNVRWARSFHLMMKATLQISTTSHGTSKFVDTVGSSVPSSSPARWKTSFLRHVPSWIVAPFSPPLLRHWALRMMRTLRTLTCS